MTPDTAFLYSHYQRCFQKIAADKFCRTFADEKIRHSMQVVGAGNYIMKHEQTFQNQPEDFLRCARLAYLLHDIGRFREIELIFENQSRQISGDHGIFGYDILKNHPAYKDPRIILPVKHHGHMIEAFYADPEYQNIANPHLKEEIRAIIFLTRDADKIANLYLHKHSQHLLEDLFFDQIEPQNRNLPISPDVLEDFSAHQTILLSKIKSLSDRILGILSWVFDINYLSSFVFCQKLGCFENILRLLSQYNPDKKSQEKVEQTLKSFITIKCKQLGG